MYGAYVHVRYRGIVVDLLDQILPSTKLKMQWWFSCFVLMTPIKIQSEDTRLWIQHAFKWGEQLSEYDCVPKCHIHIRGDIMGIGFPPPPPHNCDSFVICLRSDLPNGTLIFISRKYTLRTNRPYNPYIIQRENQRSHCVSKCAAVTNISCVWITWSLVRVYLKSSHTYRSRSWPSNPCMRHEFPPL